MVQDQQHQVKMMGRVQKKWSSHMAGKSENDQAMMEKDSWFSNY